MQLSANGFATRLFSRSGDDISLGLPRHRRGLRRLSRRRRWRAAGRQATAPFSPSTTCSSASTARPSRASSSASTRPTSASMTSSSRGEEDLRQLPLRERRSRLEQLLAQLHLPRADLSPAHCLRKLRGAPRRMVRRPRRRHRGADAEALGQPLCLGPPARPLVQMEARPPHHRLRAHVCRSAATASAPPTIPTILSAPGAAATTGDDELVPVGKAYSGFTDEELLKLDRFVRNNTIEKFGPGPRGAPGAGVRGRLRCRPGLEPPQIGRRHALPPHPSHPLGQARRRGRPAGDPACHDMTQLS